MSLSFDLLKTEGRARRGTLVVNGITIQTPVFMPVGTAATVKGMTSTQIADTSARIILANTYHLALRPGADVVQKMGGLHQFMNWTGAILTDSGGFQVFSLAQDCKISDHGAVFRSHLDGSPLELTPEKAIEIQEKLGSDIAMCLDECPAFGSSPEKLQSAVQRTINWARRCRDASKRKQQSVFGIVQGGTNLNLRESCAMNWKNWIFRVMPLAALVWGKPPNKWWQLWVIVHPFYLKKNHAISWVWADHKIF